MCGKGTADPAQFAFVPPSGATAMPTPPALLAAGDPAPDFTVFDAGGKPLKLSDFKGQIVVLDFWATWCQPCQKAMPHLSAVRQSVQGQPVTFLGVCVWDDRTAFDAWIGKKQAVYPLTFGFDPAAQDSKDSIAVKLYQVNSIPVTYVIGKDGRIAAALSGDDAPIDDHRLEGALAKLGVDLPTKVAAANEPAQK